MTRSTAQREDQPSMSLDKGTKEEITKKFQLQEGSKQVLLTSEEPDASHAHERFAQIH